MARASAPVAGIEHGCGYICLPQPVDPALCNRHLHAGPAERARESAADAAQLRRAGRNMAQSWRGHRLHLHRPPARATVQALPARRTCGIYLVASALTCRKPGLPDHTIDTSAGETVAFMVRQLRPSLDTPKRRAPSMMRRRAPSMRGYQSPQAHQRQRRQRFSRRPPPQHRRPCSLAGYRPPVRRRCPARNRSRSRSRTWEATAARVASSLASSQHRAASSILARKRCRRTAAGTELTPTEVAAMATARPPIRAWTVFTGRSSRPGAISRTGGKASI